MANSGKALVIVESPAKAKTINKYLGSGYEVRASMGHIRDLPSKGINVDIENGFEPTYDIMPGKKRTVTSLKSLAKKCDRLAGSAREARTGCGWIAPRPWACRSCPRCRAAG